MINSPIFDKLQKMIDNLYDMEIIIGDIDIEIENIFYYIYNNIESLDDYKHFLDNYAYNGSDLLDVNISFNFIFYKSYNKLYLGLLLFPKENPKINDFILQCIQNNYIDCLIFIIKFVLNNNDKFNYDKNELKNDISEFILNTKNFKAFELVLKYYNIDNQQKLNNINLINYILVNDLVDHLKYLNDQFILNIKYYYYYLCVKHNSGNCISYIYSLNKRKSIKNLILKLSNYFNNSNILEYL